MLEMSQQPGLEKGKNARRETGYIAVYVHLKRRRPTTWLVLLDRMRTLAWPQKPEM